MLRRLESRSLENTSTLRALVIARSKKDIVEVRDVSGEIIGVAMAWVDRSPSESNASNETGG